MRYRCVRAQWRSADTNADGYHDATASDRYPTAAYGDSGATYGNRFANLAAAHRNGVCNPPSTDGYAFCDTPAADSFTHGDVHRHARTITNFHGDCSANIQPDGNGVGFARPLADADRNTNTGCCDIWGLPPERSPVNGNNLKVLPCP